MKAVRFHEHGALDKLVYEDAPDPQIEENEVLVRVEACALNHMDIWVRGGLPNLSVPLPHISGADVSGRVEETGRLVTGVTPGQRVLLAPGIGCGKCSQCLSGKDNQCLKYDILGLISDGGYAELVKVPETNVVPIPEDMGCEEAAAFPLVFLTAWHMLVGRAAVKPGEDVLVMAAGSGVGHAAIQIAKLFGARVITTAGTEEKMEKAQKLGADEAINYNKQDVLQEVRRLTGKKGVEVVIEHIGADTWTQSLNCLSRNGRLVICGATSGSAVQTDLWYLFGKHISVHGSYMGEKGELLEALKFFKEGRIRPVVHAVFPLKEAAEAQRTMIDRKQFGKIVLTP